MSDAEFREVHRFVKEGHFDRLETLVRIALRERRRLKDIVPVLANTARDPRALQVFRDLKLFTRTYPRTMQGQSAMRADDFVLPSPDVLLLERLACGGETTSRNISLKYARVERYIVFPT